MKILDPIRILETIEKLGARKSIKYAFIGTGCILVVVVPICYAITSVKSRGKSKEQNNASANKQGEIKCTSECKIRGRIRPTPIVWRKMHKFTNIIWKRLKPRKRLTLKKWKNVMNFVRTEMRKKANQPLVGLHLNGIPESYHEVCEKRYCSCQPGKESWILLAAGGV